MYIAKKRIKQAIAENGDNATFDQIADWTEYECIELACRLSQMVDCGELTKCDNRYYLKGART